jgi:hypothetical protein
LRVLLLTALIITSIIVVIPQSSADVLPPYPSGSCQFSKSVYNSGDSIVVYVHVETLLIQPVLIGNTPQGQVEVSLGASLNAGDYSFTVGTAAPPSGDRDVVLYSLYGIGPPPGVPDTRKNVEVAICGYNVVPEFYSTTAVLIAAILSVLLVTRKKSQSVKRR